MKRPALGYKARDRRGAVLVREQPDAAVAHSLVVRNELADRLARSGYGGWIPLVPDATHLALDGSFEHAIVTAEMPDDGLDGHACGAGDPLKSQLSRRLIPEDRGRRIEDRGSGPLGGLSPPDHPVGPRRHIHIS